MNEWMNEWIKQLVFVVMLKFLYCTYHLLVIITCRLFFSASFDFNGLFLLIIENDIILDFCKGCLYTQIYYNFFSDNVLIKKFKKRNSFSFGGLWKFCNSVRTALAYRKGKWTLLFFG